MFSQLIFIGVKAQTFIAHEQHWLLLQEKWHRRVVPAILFEVPKIDALDYLDPSCFIMPPYFLFCHIVMFIVVEIFGTWALFVLLSFNIVAFHLYLRSQHPLVKSSIQVQISNVIFKKPVFYLRLQNTC